MTGDRLAAVVDKACRGAGSRRRPGRTERKDTGGERDALRAAGLWRWGSRQPAGLQGLTLLLPLPPGVIGGSSKFWWLWLALVERPAVSATRPRLWWSDGLTVKFCRAGAGSGGDQVLESLADGGVFRGNILVERRAEKSAGPGAE